MTIKTNHLRVLALALPATVAIVCLLAFATGPANATGTQTIQIPLRWCALNGSPAAEGNTNSILLQRQMRANDIWTTGANIIFSNPFPTSVPPDSANFLVIDDPRPPKVGIGCPGPDCNSVENGVLGPGEQGDILQPEEEPTIVPESFAEYKEARAECEEEWDQMALPPPLGLGVSMKGTIALNIREFVPKSAGNIFGTAGRGERPAISSAVGADPTAGCEIPPTELRRSRKRSWA
jgi:hypothetical protein